MPMLKYLLFAVALIMLLTPGHARAEYDGGSADMVVSFYCITDENADCVQDHYKMAHKLYLKAWDELKQKQECLLTNPNCFTHFNPAVFQRLIARYRSDSCPLDKNPDLIFVDAHVSCLAAFDVQRIVDIESLTGASYQFPDTAYGKHLNEMMRREGNVSGFHYASKNSDQCKPDAMNGSLTWHALKKFCDASCPNAVTCAAELQSKIDTRTQSQLNPAPTQFKNAKDEIDTDARDKLIASRKTHLAIMDKYKDYYCQLVGKDNGNDITTTRLCEIAVINGMNDLWPMPY